MIKKLILIALALASFTTAPARADVVVQDANNVIIAGRNVGTVVDALLNQPAKRAEIHAALRTCITDLTAAKRQAETTLSETQAFAESLVARAKAAHAKGDAAALAKVIQDAATPAAERKRAALEAEKAKLDAQKAALDAQIAELPK
jgi:hypothetical protein